MQLGGVFVDFALGGVRVKGHVEGVLVGGTFWGRVWWRENSELVLTVNLFSSISLPSAAIPHLVATAGTGPQCRPWQ